MSLESPTVSIVVLAYKAPGYLAATLRSIEGQTLTDYEVLVFTDSAESTDTQPAKFVRQPYFALQIYLSARSRFGSNLQSGNCSS